MRIDIPPSAYPITRVTLETPSGRISGQFDGSHRKHEFVLPEGVSEDDVRVTVQFLTSNRAVKETFVLKEPKPKPKPVVTRFDQRVKLDAKSLGLEPKPTYPNLVRINNQGEELAPKPEPTPEPSTETQEAAGANAEPNSASPEPPHATP